MRWHELHATYYFLCLILQKAIKIQNTRVGSCWLNFWLCIHILKWSIPILCSSTPAFLVSYPILSPSPISPPPHHLQGSVISLHETKCSLNCSTMNKRLWYVQRCKKLLLRHASICKKWGYSDRIRKYISSSHILFKLSENFLVLIWFSRSLPAPSSVRNYKLRVLISFKFGTQCWVLRSASYINISNVGNYLKV